MKSEPEAVFHALDLDRTLFDTALLVERVFEALEQQNPKLAHEVVRVTREYAERHESFFLFKYLLEQMGPKKLDQLVTTIQKKHKPASFLLPGAKERIAFGSSRPDWSVGILTYGEVEGQRIKVRLAGFVDMPVLVIDSPYKGSVIASWKQKDDTFLLPEAFGSRVVDTVVLDDDKQGAFEGMPKEAIGQWITHAALQESKSELDLPVNVTGARDLHASIKYLKQVL